jgi:acyl-CoA synthetase (NDP forming)
MVVDSVEMIAGITHDPAFGPLVMVGAGGVNAELLADRNLHVLPLTDIEAAGAVRSLRLSPLLFGYRGRPRVAVDRLEDLLTRLAQLADDLPEIAELDANPVLVTPAGAFVAASRSASPAPTPLPRHSPPPPMSRERRSADGLGAMGFEHQIDCSEV